MTTGWSLERGGRLALDEVGVRVRPFWTRSWLLLTWDALDGFSPTPAMRRRDGIWTHFAGTTALDGRRQTRRTLPFFSLVLVVKDRHAVARRVPWPLRVWLRGGLALRPLYGADDAPLPTRGLVELYLAPGPLRRQPDRLRELLDRLSDRLPQELVCF